MIFGGSGFVGGNLAERAIRSGWRVTVADTRPGPRGQWISVDITLEESVRAAFEAVRPDAVVNLAAVADIDLAEREPEVARKVNFDGARYVAAACAKSKIRYVFFSSDAVFSGEDKCFREDDVPNPVNIYGRTKLMAEEAVLSIHPAAAVIRISLVLGFSLAGGNSFLNGLNTKLSASQSITAPAYEIRTPIDVLTLSDCVLELCSNDIAGIIHLGATDSIDRYTLSCRLASRMGYPPDLIQPQSEPDSKPGRAPRHRNGILSVEKALRYLKTPLLSTEQGIERIFKEQNYPTRS
jgi:dTDP-4-dehydrorhamnose reductase